MAQYMIVKHPGILRFFSSRHPAICHAYAIAIAAAVIWRLGYDRSASPIYYFLISGLYWSFVEYWIHRSFFHWQPKHELLHSLVGSFHLYHHQNPDDRRVITSGWVTVLFGTGLHLGILTVLLGFDLQRAASTFVWVLAWYGFYEWVHYAVHYRVFRFAPMRYLQEYHLSHHLQPNGNYGQTSPLWDYVFRTVRPVQNLSQTPRMQRFVFGYEEKKA